ncbi:hypothetical protein GOODEAATRI_013557 [Goodea atripinnis]|uniref:Uncharacterized protein n=1 Tax=Goodea atripinnis TaxID=208336 RepID=A0ABV0PNE6_9TELE
MWTYLSMLVKKENTDKTEEAQVTGATVFQPLIEIKIESQIASALAARHSLRIKGSDPGNGGEIKNIYINDIFTTFTYIFYVKNEIFNTFTVDVWRNSAYCCSSSICICVTFRNLFLQTHER